MCHIVGLAGSCRFCVGVNGLCIQKLSMVGFVVAVHWVCPMLFSVVCLVLVFVSPLNIISVVWCVIVAVFGVCVVMWRG